MSKDSLSPSSTKRYAIPQNMKDSFYAIHHLQQLKENQHTSPSSENNSEPKDGDKKRGRKRPSTENSKPLEPVQTQQRKKFRQPQGSSKARKSNEPMPTLYQTCINVWPEGEELGDYGHDNIQALSNLLKVRLCQAKFKMMAKLDQENELFTFLAEEYMAPQLKKPHTIHLSTQRTNKSSLSMVGNGRNLFQRQHIQEDHIPQPTTPLEIVHSPQRHSTLKKEKKKRTPRASNTTTKTKRNATPKRRSAAADVTPIVQSDGILRKFKGDWHFVYTHFFFS